MENKKIGSALSVCFDIEMELRLRYLEKFENNIFNHDSETLQEFGVGSRPGDRTSGDGHSRSF